ncbi:hypothetical protein Q7P35_003536 [Cladosporium inversicolor]
MLLPNPSPPPPQKKKQFLQYLKLSGKISTVTKLAQNDRERDPSTSTSHLRPSRPRAASRRRMPALATHISAPNLLCAPTTSFSTYYVPESKLNRDIEVFH